VILRRTVFNHDVAAVDITGLAEALTEGIQASI